MLTLGAKSTLYDTSQHNEVVEAFQIASVILSSAAFQDAMRNSAFVYPNHCLTCTHKTNRSSVKLAGQTVIDSLSKAQPGLFELGLGAG